MMNALLKEKNNSEEKCDSVKNLNELKEVEKIEEPTNAMMMKIIMMTMQQMAQSISVLMDVVVTIFKSNKEDKKIIKSINKLK